MTHVSEVAAADAEDAAADAEEAASDADADADAEEFGPLALLVTRMPW